MITVKSLFIPLSEFGKVVVSKISVVVVELVIAPVVLAHMYVSGSGFQCPSLVQVAVMVILGNKPSSQMKDNDSNTDQYPVNNATY